MFSIIIFYSCSSSSETEKKPKVKKRIMTPGPKKKEGDEEPMVEDVQHLTPDTDVVVGDKIRVFYHSFDTIYEAKVKRVQDQKPWPKYYVHYQGWNARYDEWITRARIKENLSWSQERNKSKKEPSVSSSTSESVSAANSEDKVDETSKKKILKRTPSKKGPATLQKDQQPSRAGMYHLRICKSRNKIPFTYK